jgi:arylsulfatase A-like enzyme
MNVAPDPRQPGSGETFNYVVTAIAAGVAAFGVVGILLRGGPRVARRDATPIASFPPPPPLPLHADQPAAKEATTAGAAAAVPRPTYNVLLLTVDTLRADLGFTGYPRPVTPRLDELAARSTVFENAYSTASYTPKAMGPLMIGRYMTETKRDGEHYTTFFPSNTFVAERAHAAGVRTLAGVCHRYFLWKKGFQEGFDIYDTSASPPDPRDDDTRITSDHLSDAIIRLLGKPENATPTTPAHRFFGWFHYIDPHTPYVPHKGAPNFAAMPPAGTPSARAQYDAEVWFTDSQIGRVVDFVRSQRWGKETVIIVTADHGEAFGEKNHWRHGREVWEPLIRVPLIINLPPRDGNADAGAATGEAAPRRVAVKRSHIDLVPTILDLLGVRTPPGTFHGTSLRADMTGRPEELPERDVFVDMPSGPYNEARRAVITGPTPGTKLIYFGGKHYEAYDLAADPAEAHALPRTDPRFVEAKEHLEKMIASLDEQPASP